MPSNRKSKRSKSPPSAVLDRRDDPAIVPIRPTMARRLAPAENVVVVKPSRRL